MKKILLNSGEEIEVSDDIADIVDVNSILSDGSQQTTSEKQQLPSVEQVYTNSEIVDQTTNIFCYVTFLDGTILTGIVCDLKIFFGGSSKFVLSFILFKQDVFKWIMKDKLLNVGKKVKEITFNTSANKEGKKYEMDTWDLVEMNFENSTPEMKCTMAFN